MTTIILLRHGETAYNAKGNRYCGRTDIELAPSGEVQAQAMALHLRNISISQVYSSPLKRARQTAQLASGRLSVITDERLTEVDFGNWEGKTREEFIAENRELWKNWMNDPGKAKAGGTGETGLEVVARADSFFNNVARQHAGETILVVGHNGLNRLYIAYKLGMPLKHYQRIAQENASITVFDLDASGNFTLKKLNSKSL